MQMKKITSLLVFAIIATLAVCLFGCNQQSPKEAYIQYNVKMGGETIGGTTANTQTKIDAKENGEIRITRSEETPILETPSFKYSYVISIPSNSTVAEVSATCDIDNITARVEQTAKGTLNIASYKYGDSITWDDMSDDALTRRGMSSYIGVNMLDANASHLEGAFKALERSVTSSGTNCTMQDLGFSKL